MGAELFLWVHGARDAAPEDIFNNELNLVDWAPAAAKHRGILDSDGMKRYYDTHAILQSCIDACAEARESPETFPTLRARLIKLAQVGGTVLPQAEVSWLQRQYSITSDRQLEAIDEHLRQCMSLLNGERKSAGA
jgi:hypothetical protein